MLFPHWSAPDRRAPRSPLPAAALLALLGLALTGGVLLPAGSGSAASAPRADRAAPQPPDGSAATTGTTLPPAPQSVRAVQFATASQPVGAFMREGDDTVYVVEKLGKIRAWSDGAFAEEPVIDLTRVVDSDNERGLLGLAFHPSRREVIYIDYTARGGNVRVSEVPFDGRTADFSRERNLLTIAKPFNEHNAGTLLFDDLGLLYVAIGDGGGSNDRFNNAQRKDVLLGKVLRIDPEPNAKAAYSIPPANPFVRPGLARVRPEILAYGLRNPWQISRDPATGDLWIPDVGEHNREEINRMASGTIGSNFGWKVREGLVANGGARPVGAVDPVYDYPHKDGRCAVVGGAVYRGQKLAALRGMYVFGDVCTGSLMALRRNGRRWEALGLGGHIPYLTSIRAMNDGELIASSLEGGLFRLEP